MSTYSKVFAEKMRMQIFHFLFIQFPATARACLIVIISLHVGIIIQTSCTLKRTNMNKIKQTDDHVDVPFQQIAQRQAQVIWRISNDNYSNSERIIKFGYHLPKLCSNEKGSSFF